jgi:methanogenic corrinoid protein MtbC1
MNLYLAGNSVHEICDGVIAASFHEIGERWSHGDVEVYQERRGVEICRQILAQLRLSLPGPAESAAIAIGGTLEHDPYTLPTTMAELTLLETGWDARSYGSGHPAATLCAALRDVRPKLLWLSVSSYRSEEELLDECGAIYHAAREHGAALIVGGRALNQSLRERMTYSVYCDTLRHLASFAETMKLA